ncbi:MAG: hypothetical protein JKX83_11570 [Pseudomonadales bacterium]|nr:hypothetical protein [Pseudomonadales bacterium]
MLNIRNWVVYEARYSASFIFVGTFVFLLLWYGSAGAFSAGNLPGFFSSKRQLIGTIAMLVILPSFLLSSYVRAQRRTFSLLSQLQAPSLPNYAGISQDLSVGFVFGGTLLGLSYSLLNLPGQPSEITAAGPVIIAIAIGQLHLWSVVGLILGARLRSSLLFHRAGKLVTFNLFETSKLKIFAQTGLTDALIVLVGLTLSVLQALDAQFRYDNYLLAVVVCLPAIVVLMITPMYSLHLRLRDQKQTEIEAVNVLIRNASKALSGERIQQLEQLLQRRDRLKSLSTWPLDVSVVSRLLLYIVIPPLAWLGAAFVEIGLDGVLKTGGG